MTTESIAKVCHAAIAALNQSEGWTYPLWDFLSPEDKDLFIGGVLEVLAHPGVTPEEIHNYWVADRAAAGWTFANVRSFERREHPSMVPFAQLPVTEQVKDTLFVNIVHALLPMV